MPILSLLVVNLRLPLFHMAKRFIWIIVKQQHINEFTIGYKSFIEQVEKCMYTMFGEIAYPFIKATNVKKNTNMLALIMFYETRSDKNLLDCSDVLGTTTTKENRKKNHKRRRI